LKMNRDLEGKADNFSQLWRTSYHHNYGPPIDIKPENIDNFPSSILLS
jgi:hypothetical protein